MGRESRKLAHTSGIRPGCASDSGLNPESDAHLVQTLGVCASFRVSGTRDQRIRALAAVQHDRVSRSQLLAAGISYEAIATRVHRGQLLLLPGSVFALAPLDTSELKRHAAALLAVGFDAAIGGISALGLWGLLQPLADQPVCVLAPLGARRSLAGITVHRTRHLPPEDIRIRDGLPVTTPARALLDSADRLTPRRLERAFDQALVNRVMYRQDLARQLARTRGRAAAGRLRTLLDRETGTTLTRSPAEDQLVVLMRRANFPPFAVNALVAGYEVDFFWPEHRLVVEIDGFQFHAHRGAFERDHLKDSVLRAAGLDVRRFTPEQVTTNPYAVIADVARGLWTGRRD